MMRRLVATWLFGVVAAVAAADETRKPDDFAFGRQLRVEADAPVHTVRIPEAVYRESVRADLGDLRVFNADDELVPFRIVPATDGTGRARQRRDLAFFPVRQPDTNSAGQRLLLRLGDYGEGPVLDLPWSAPGVGDQGQGDRAYLLRAGVVDRPLAALELQWRGQAQAIGRARVQASDDLRQWRTVAADVPLAEMTFQGRALRQNRIELGAVSARFLRLEWPDAFHDIELTRATAVAAAREALPATRWLEPERVASHPADGVVELDTGGHFPVRRLRIGETPANTLARLRLASRNTTDNETWTARAAGLYYAVTADGAQLRRQELTLDTPSKDRYWRLTAQPAGSVTEQARIRLGYQPDRLEFVPRGNQPFTLAWGSRSAEPLPELASMVATLSAETDGSGRASLGDPVSLGGPQRTAPPERGLPWGVLALWTLLTGAVAAVLIMGYRLLREIGDNDAGTE